MLCLCVCASLVSTIWNRSSTWSTPEYMHTSKYTMIDLLQARPFMSCFIVKVEVCVHECTNHIRLIYGIYMHKYYIEEARNLSIVFLSIFGAWCGFLSLLAMCVCLPLFSCLKILTSCLFSITTGFVCQPIFFLGSFVVVHKHNMFGNILRVFIFFFFNYQTVNTRLG